MKGRQQQILAFCLPGDAVDLQSLFLNYTDHALEAHAASTVAKVRQTDIADVMQSCPKIMKALWLDAMLDAAIFREWAANLGARSARQRLAHLLLEMEVRYRRSEGAPFSLPVKQAALASSLGLSLVHLNKSLQWLRREGFVAVEGRMFQITERDAPVSFAGFDPSYLHLQTLSDSAHKSVPFVKTYPS